MSHWKCPQRRQKNRYRECGRAVARRFFNGFLASVDRNGSRRNRKRTNVRLVWTAATFLIFLASVGVEHAVAQGVSPGSFSYRLHDAVPLLQVNEFFPEFQRVADGKALLDVAPVSQAGAHADTTVTWVLDIKSRETAENGSDDPTDIIVNAPPGIFTNFTAVPPCPIQEFERMTNREESASGCPASQVGVISSLFGGGINDRSSPIYRLPTQPGTVATFGFPYLFLAGEVHDVIIEAKLRTDDDYGITLSRREEPFFSSLIPAGFMTFWGVPADPSHDPERWNREWDGWGALVSTPPVPLMSNASNCNAGNLEAKLQLHYRWPKDRWLPEDPEDLAYRSFSPDPDGCEALIFNPSVELSPSTNEADSSSGISMQLNFRPNFSQNDLETPPLKDAEFTLPAGMSINPAAADGLVGCTTKQVGFQGSEFPMPNPIRFSLGVANCPDMSQIGTAIVDTPLADKPLEGAIYLATPYENPFQSPLAAYLVLNGPSAPEYGPNFTIKLAVKVAVDKQTGQVTFRIESLPQLPVDSAELKLSGGPRAPFATSLLCESGSADSRLVPWSAPQSGPPVEVDTDFEVDSGPGESPCQYDAKSLPFIPGLVAGTTDATASAFSSLVLRVTRPAGDQELKDFNVRFPRGLVANTQGVAFCSGVDIEHAEARNGVGKGVVERSNPSCPADSKVGSVWFGVGAGLTPMFVKGNIYLAGPYEGEPFSLVAITPALAGGNASHPLFDLGTLVDRIALKVDPQSAQITAQSDQLRRTLAGVPLRIDDISVLLDREGFVRNPTNCDEMKVTTEIEGANGAQAAPVNRFHVGGCAPLNFRPKIHVELKGGMRRGQHPQLRAALNSEQDQTAMSKARITLPSAEIVNPDRLADACSKGLSTQHRCPKNSLVGRATVRSPFLAQPLKGPVYLRSSGLGLPDVVISLGGEVSLELLGELDLTTDHRVQVTFSGIPDISLDSFVINMRGLLTNDQDLCLSPLRFAVRLTAQSGMTRSQRLPGGNYCAVHSGLLSDGRREKRR